MRDLIIAAVRTSMQTLAALAVAALANLGIVVDVVSVENVLVAVAVGVVTIVLNLLAGKAPWLNQIMSLGLSKADPKYVE